MVWFPLGMTHAMSLTFNSFVSTGFTLDTTHHIKWAMASYWDVDWVLLGLCSRRLF